MNRFGLQDVNSIFLNLNIVLMNDLNIDIIEDIDIIDGSGILNIWGNRLYDIFTIIFKYFLKKNQKNQREQNLIMNLDLKRYVLRILDSKQVIKIFLKLVGVNITKGTIYMIFDSDEGKWLYNSLQYDNKDTQNVKYLTIRDYLNSYPISPKLKELYQILQPEGQFLRTTDKVVGFEKGSEYIKARHVGINPEELKEDEIQALVDYFYSKRQPFYMGYIFYMFYERLHPNSNYNGVLGRIVFLENGHHDEHFPVSIFIKDVKCKYVDDIYELFSFPQKVQTSSNNTVSNSTGSSSSSKSGSSFVESQDNQKYLSIKVGKKSVSKIILILLFSVLYYKYYHDEEAKQILVKYFQNPFKNTDEFDNTKIKNFKEIREMINELNWNKEDRK